MLPEAPGVSSFGRRMRACSANNWSIWTCRRLLLVLELDPHDQPLLLHSARTGELSDDAPVSLQCKAGYSRRFTTTRQLNGMARHDRIHVFYGSSSTPLRHQSLTNGVRLRIDEQQHTAAVCTIHVNPQGYTPAVHVYHAEYL